MTTSQLAWESSRLQWMSVAEGVWKVIIGTPDELTPLSAAGGTPRIDALRGMGAVAFPFSETAVDIARQGQHLVIGLPLELDEAIYGFGLQFFRVDHRSRTRYLRVNSDPHEDTGESHAPVPFYVSSRGYGVMVNTANIVTVYCGSTMRSESRFRTLIRDRMEPDWIPTPVSDRLEMVVNTAGLELYVFAGATPLEVVRRYNLLCGGGVLPPRWGLGIWHRVHMLYSDEQVLADALSYREHDFPCDVIGLEPGWHTYSYPVSYEWSRERFPNPAAFIETMVAHHFYVNLWEHPWVSTRSKIYGALEPYAGSHTVWGGLAPDYSLAEARTILADQHEQTHVRIGVSGYKIDECDGSELTPASWYFPAHAHFPSGHDGEQMRQVYGLLLQRLTADLFHKANRRTYGLARASLVGAAPLPYVLYSDLSDLRQYVRALCNAGFSGLLWCPEVCNVDTGEDLIRRVQINCFSPLMMVNAWFNNLKPWTFPEVEWIARKYFKLRIRLIPYLYSLFAQYHFEGTPPFRAMALQFPDAPEMRTLDTQYMVGDALLVAPLFPGERTRTVVLPAGEWYEFETGECFAGGRTIQVAPGLERIPVFVRSGSIIPLAPAARSAPSRGDRYSLELRCYGMANGKFNIYDDDGESFAFEDGEYIWHRASVLTLPDGTRQTDIQSDGRSSAGSYASFEWRFIIEDMDSGPLHDG